jgi:predicted nuclease of predicted toxin-antitoxin system
MKILADESVDLPVFKFLKEAGFDIIHIMHGHGGSPDKDVLDLAYKQERILLTVDKDFGELAFRGKRPSFGIILYRLNGLTNTEKSVLVRQVFYRSIRMIFR